MHDRFHPRLSYANVTATLALFVALGGSSYAAITITGKNVKDSSLTGRDIRNSSLTTTDVKNGTLLSTDFNPGQLPSGPQGSKGDTGAQGPKGDTGPQGLQGAPGTNGAANVVVRRLDVNGTGQLNGTASCNAGERATGGGFYAGGNGANVTVLNSYPVPLTNGAVPTAWHVDVINQTNAAASMGGNIFAVCAAP